METTWPQGLRIMRARIAFTAILLILMILLQNAGVTEAQTNVQVYPVADNYADSKYPRSMYGHVAALYVGNSYDHAQNIWGSERIYIRFDISNLPKNREVVQARLVLWQYYAPATDQIYDAHRVLGNWNETTQNWENQPSWVALKTSSALAPARVNATVEWDLTSDVRAWYLGSARNYGTMIKAAIEERVRDASSGFFSREYPYEELKPRLIVRLAGNPTVTYEVKVTTAGLPTGVTATISVDGEPYDTIASGQEKGIILDRGTTHTVAVTQIIAGQAGARYLCNDSQIRLSNAGSHVFEYSTEYEVVFVTAPGDMFQTPPNGWYQAGTSLIVNRTSPQIVEVAPGIRLAFKGWYVNAQKVEESSECLACREGTPTTIVVSSPATVRGLYETEYYLNVTSPFGSTKGTGWYAANATATFSVEPTSVSVEGVLGLLGMKTTFVQWVGSSSFLGLSAASQAAVTMSGPTTVEAIWQEDPLSLLPDLLVMLLIAAIVVIAIITRRRVRDRSAVRDKSLARASLRSAPASLANAVSSRA
jgi:hypothetical protein